MAPTNSTCSIPDCARLVRARGWCQKHYDRWWHHGSPYANFRTPRPLEEKLRLRVNKSAPSGCWLWTSSLDADGYGQLSHGRGNTLKAHRVAWEQAFGPIPDGLGVLHHCDVRNCIRPDHLFLGTQADNNADAVTKGRNKVPSPPNMRGEANPQSKLNDQDIPIIRVRIGTGERLLAIADDFNVTASTISLIGRGRTWTHV